MANQLVGFVVILLIILVVVVSSFAFLDRFLKSSPKKDTEKNTAPKKVSTDKPKAEPIAETKTPPNMKIYNSELADDLNAMLKNTNSATTSRLQIENHINKESNITKYLQSKNYRSFDFGTDDNLSVTDDTDEPLSFTRDDYKRIMALSNIDDKKSL